jgi:hypothetical protein
MNRDQALSKIKKCMALGKSANPHEAAAAMRQAQKLMEQHGIDETEVALADVAEVRCRAALQSGPRWEARLADMIGEAFGCDVIWSAERKLIGFKFCRHTLVVFIGVGAAPHVASYAWALLDRQCSAQRLAHIRQQPKSCKSITRTARGDAFADGWVTGVRNKLQAFAGERHQLLIEQFCAVHYPNMTTKVVKSRAVGRNVKDGSVHAGFVAGREAQLDHGIGNRSQELLT